MPIPVIRYPLDPTGRAATHLIAGEPHDLARSTDRVIVPKYNPFFARSLKVYRRGQSTPLVPEVDYRAIEMNVDATYRYSGEICHGIYLIRSNLGMQFDITYQTLGGEWGLSGSAIQDYLDAIRLDDRPVRWGSILGKPLGYPAAPHMHDIGDVYGFEHVVVALEQIRKAILEGDQDLVDDIRAWVQAELNALNQRIETKMDQLRSEFDDHKNDKNNPHETTKAHVGLGLVDNFRTATKAEAEEGTRNNLFMTPLRTIEAIKKHSNKRAILEAAEFGYWKDPETGFTHCWGVSPEVPQDEYYYFFFRQPMLRVFGITLTDMQRNVDVEIPTTENSRYDVELSAKVLKRTVSNRGFMARVYRLFGSNVAQNAPSGTNTRDTVTMIYHAVGIADDSLPLAPVVGKKYTSVNRFDEHKDTGWWSGGLNAWKDEGWNNGPGSGNFVPIVVEPFRNLDFEQGNVGWILGNTGNIIHNTAVLPADTSNGSYYARVVPTGKNDTGRDDVSAIETIGSFTAESVEGYLIYATANVTAKKMAGVQTPSWIGTPYTNIKILPYNQGGVKVSYTTNSYNHGVNTTLNGFDEERWVEAFSIVDPMTPQQHASNEITHYKVNISTSFGLRSTAPVNALANYKNKLFTEYGWVEVFKSKIGWAKGVSKSIYSLTNESGSNRTSVNLIVSNSSNGLGSARLAMNVSLEPHCEYELTFNFSITLDTVPTYHNHGSMSASLGDAYVTFQTTSGVATSTGSKTDTFNTDHTPRKVLIGSVQLESSGYLNNTRGSVSVGNLRKVRSLLAPQTNPKPAYNYIPSALTGKRSITAHGANGIVFRHIDKTNLSDEPFVYVLGTAYQDTPGYLTFDIEIKRQDPKKFVGVMAVPMHVNELDDDIDEQYIANALRVYKTNRGSATAAAYARASAPTKYYYQRELSTFFNNQLNIRESVVSDYTSRGRYRWMIIADIKDPNGEVIVHNIRGAQFNTNPPYR